MRKPIVSCLMANYNTNKGFLKAAIDSILSQTLDAFELIIIDDCSTDDGFEVLKEYAKSDDRIKLYRNERNMGLPLSLNRALEYATCDYIARMDTDDVAMSDRFEKQFEYLVNNELDLVGAEVNRMDENGKIVAFNTNKSYPPKTVSQILSVSNYVVHPTWFAKREVYFALNGYRDINSCEDYDFLLRAKFADFKIGIADNVLLNYRFNTNSISRKNALRQIVTSNYLSKNEKSIDAIDVEKLKEYVGKRLSDKKCAKYAVAAVYFEKFCVELKNSKLKAMKFLALSLLKSRYAFINLSRAIKIRKIKRQIAKG